MMPEQGMGVPTWLCETVLQVVHLKPHNVYALRSGLGVCACKVIPGWGGGVRERMIPVWGGWVRENDTRLGGVRMIPGVCERELYLVWKGWGVSENGTWFGVYANERDQGWDRGVCV